MAILAEGGYQPFHLSSAEWIWLVFAAVCALTAIATGFILMRGVLESEQGTPSMIEIAKAVQEGAQAYLIRQFRVIGIIVLPLAVLVFFTASSITRILPDGTKHTALGFGLAGLFRALAFLVGGTLSGLAGYIGMSTAVRGNVRTAAAARDGQLAGALKVAFRTGAVTGMFVVGLGLLGATIIVMLFQNYATAILVGFGFGGSLLALFMRVGGGIFTKAADVGADLVGKVEAGIPEDDPRNAATIADNVGDNVGDCAGMGADLFESYVVVLVASLILANTAFGTRGQVGLAFSLAVPAIGILASIVGIFVVRATPKDRSAMAPINRGLLTSAVLTIVGVFFVAQFYVHNLKVFWAVVTGVVLGQVASRVTEYYTSTETTPVRDIAESARTGPATTVLSGISTGLESSVPAIIAIVLAIVVAIGLGDGNIQFELYLVSVAGLGLLSNAGIVVSEDTFGPVLGQRRRHRRDERRVPGRAGADHGQPGRRGQHHQGGHEGVRHRLRGDRLRGPVRQLHPDHRGERQTAGRRVDHQQPALHQRLADHHQRRQPQDLHRPADRRVHRLPLLGPGHSGRGALGGHGGPGGAPSVPRAPGDHGPHRAARVRPGHRHLHGRRPTGAGHPGPAGHPVASRGGLRHRRSGSGRLPRRHHPHRPADGQLPQQLRRCLGQRQEVHRGRP